MKTIMKIGEYLADPVVTAILLTVIIIPVFWGIFKFLKWIKYFYSEKENNSFVE